MFRQRALQVVLVIVGVLFVAIVYPMVMDVLHEQRAGYGPMMMSVYFTLGIYLLMAVRNPAAHRSLIGFAAWSSLAHAAVMVWQATRHAEGRAELLGASVMLGVIWLLLVVLAPAKETAKKILAAA